MRRANRRWLGFWLGFGPLPPVQFGLMVQSLLTGIQSSSVSTLLSASGCRAVRRFDRENICRFGDADDGKIVMAAQMADVHDMIQRLPDGYNTQIGDAGAALSGGQRQRIGLARALYGMPALIVLDEPNASLDSAGEQALMNTIVRLKEAGSTVVMVTHKTNALSQCDAILVLQDGAVQAFGPRDEVMSRIIGPRVVPGPGQTVVAQQASTAV